MPPAIPKTALQIAGEEYDWLGTDQEGNIALFSTAGAGYAPEAFLRDTESHDSAIEQILSMPATTEARHSPAVAPGCINTWRSVAERGLYAYDCDPNGGPYVQVAAPKERINHADLPRWLVDVAGRVRCPFRFETQLEVGREMLVLAATSSRSSLPT